jgi:plasmid stabilization system protein ParE
LRIRAAAVASAEAKQIDEWWRANRPAAPDLFRDEFAHALSLIDALPRAGRLVRRAGISGVRYVLLRSTRYHVYYTIDADGILIVSIWSSVRGSGPDLRKLLRTREG